MMEEIEYKNKAQCLKCLSVIESTHVHDFVWCKCRTIAVDGGNDYWKMVGEPKYFNRLYEPLEKK